ncbi:GntR family transcriptional regulator [Plantactinospora sp. CA-290183]|uniref:GntR family transcriptional regulator n=1 Tax=Plantactinospora sp. CA-290183 TaxID=3240006 RepID=UPI003D909C8C
MSSTAATEVEQDLRRRIESGEFRPGAQLPKLTDLMAEYGVRSRGAMDRAIRALVGDGLLVSRQGSGIYVRERQVVRRDLVAGLHMEYDRAVRDEVATGGLFEAMTGTNGLDVATSYELVDAADRVAELLQVQAGTPLLARTFRYTIAGQPHQLTRSFMTTELARQAELTSPGSERPGIGTIAQLRKAGSTPDRVSINLETRMPTTDEREQLAISRGTPVYEHWRVMSKDGVPVEVSTAIVPGDRVAYTLNVDLGEARS